MSNDELVEKRRLHVSQSVWAQTPRNRVRSHTRLPVRDADVVVVGAGISGALVAEALANGERTVLVLDRRTPVTGSTQASTAMIQHEIDVPLFEARRRIGHDAADRAWRRSVRSVIALQARVDRLGVSCGMKAKAALYLAGDEYGSRALRMEADARLAAGVDVSYLDADTLQRRFGIDRTAALHSHASASANPAQLTAGMLRAAQDRGAIVVRDVEVTDLRADGERVTLATNVGSLLVARRVVFCTGYEFLDAVAHEKHDIASTWSFATRPGVNVPEWLKSHVVWEGSDPYLYLRTTYDGRLLVGGEDEKDERAYLDPDKLRDKVKTLRDKTSALLGIEVGAAEFTWAAAFGNTPSGLPFIDEVEGLPGVFAVMGFGGNGITFSQIASELVSAAIEGRADEDADLFGFDRPF